MVDKFDVNDLTEEEKTSLDQIRHRKATLMQDIELINEELRQVNRDIELHFHQANLHTAKNPRNTGIKHFNNDAKKGVQYLIEKKEIGADAYDIACFLMNETGLNKTMIGDYLGDHNEFNKTVLKEFVNLHNFTDMLLVEALRTFLWSFRLPGEAQKIDRMMEHFAQRYYQQNPTVFRSSDACYILSFAIIMLNTSLHNTAVREKDRQSAEQFVNMSRGINEGEDVPREVLESIYENIRTQPFKMPEDDGRDVVISFFAPTKEGWLEKQGATSMGVRLKNWKRRWFILNDRCLYYFIFTTEQEPRGIIPLENVGVRVAEDSSREWVFEIYSETGSKVKACKTEAGRVIEGKHLSYRMAASSRQERDEWVQVIKNAISFNPTLSKMELLKKSKNGDETPQ